MEAPTSSSLIYLSSTSACPCSPPPHHLPGSHARLLCLCLCVCVEESLICPLPHRLPTSILSPSCSQAEDSHSPSYMHTHTHTHTLSLSLSRVLRQYGQQQSCRREQQQKRRRRTCNYVSKVLYLVALYRKYTRTLTFENFWQAGGGGRGAGKGVGDPCAGN